MTTIPITWNQKCPSSSLLITRAMHWGKMTKNKLCFSANILSSFSPPPTKLISSFTLKFPPIQWSVHISYPMAYSPISPPSIHQQPPWGQACPWHPWSGWYRSAPAGPTNEIFQSDQLKSPEWIHVQLTEIILKPKRYCWTSVHNGHEWAIQRPPQ